MNIVDTLPVTCRHCGEEIAHRPGDADWVWVDVREGGTDDYCAMGPYASHLPERAPGELPY